MIHGYLCKLTLFVTPMSEVKGWEVTGPLGISPGSLLSRAAHVTRHRDVTITRDKTKHVVKPVEHISLENVSKVDWNMKSNKNVDKIYCYNVNTDRHLHYLLNSYFRHFFRFTFHLLCVNVSIYPFFENPQKLLNDSWLSL